MGDERPNVGNSFGTAIRSEKVDPENYVFRMFANIIVLPKHTTKYPLPCKC